MECSANLLFKKASLSAWNTDPDQNEDLETFRTITNNSIMREEQDIFDLDYRKYKFLNIN